MIDDALVKFAKYWWSKSPFGCFVLVFAIWVLPHLWCVFFPGPTGLFNRTELPLPASPPDFPLKDDDFIDLSAASYGSGLNLLVATGTRTGNSAQIHGLYLYTKKGM